MQSEHPNSHHPVFYKALNHHADAFNSQLPPNTLQEQSNQKLVNQLYDLLAHDDVRRNMDDVLKDRIDRLINHVESHRNKQCEYLQDDYKSINSISNHNQSKEIGEQISQQMLDQKQRNSRNSTAYQTQKIAHFKPKNIRKINKSLIDTQLMLLPKYKEENRLNQGSLNEFQTGHRRSVCRTSTDSKINLISACIKEKKFKENREIEKKKNVSNKKKCKINAFRIQETIPFTKEEAGKMSRNTSKGLIKRYHETQSNTTSKSKSKKSKNNSTIKADHLNINKLKAVKSSKQLLPKSYSQKSMKRCETTLGNTIKQTGKYCEQLKAKVQDSVFSFPDQNLKKMKRVKTQAEQFFGKQKDIYPQCNGHSSLEDYETWNEHEDSISIAQNDHQIVYKTNQVALKMLTVIFQKQQEIYKQKNELEDYVNQIKDQINEQKLMLEDKRSSISHLNNQIKHLQSGLNGARDQKLTAHKKLEELWGDVKKLNNVLESMKSQNSQVNDNISQQRQLITMYKTVIQQLKQQYKIEKNSRDEIKKQANTLKKMKQAHKVKCNNVGMKTEGMINSVMKSMEQWM